MGTDARLRRGLRAGPFASFSRFRSNHRGLLADCVVGLAGLVVGVVACLLWARESSPLTAQNLVAAGLVVVMTHFPLVLPQRSGDAAIGFEASALVFLGLVTSPGQALTLWFAAQLIALVMSDRGMRSRVFNLGITSVAGAALVGILARWGGNGRDTRIELLVTLLACAAYFLTDLVVTAVSLSLEDGRGFSPALRWRGVPLPLACFVGIDSLGYLGALLDRHEPSWTLGLLVVPVGTILVAVRSISEAQLAHRRLTQLFTAAASAPDWGDAEQTERILVEQAGLVLRHSEGALREQPATGTEISVPVQLRGQPARHLVVWPTSNSHRLDDDDRRALETLVSVAADSVDRRRLVDEMTHLAGHDPLTGLANRRVFTERLDHALALRGDRDDVGLAILYCDLDGFKSINDRLGHEVGDTLLTVAADRIQLCLRPADTAARLGGDEFAVLLEQGAYGGAESVAERVLANLATPFSIGGRTATLSASIGITYVSDERRAVDVMRHADTAMYRAKALGRNRAEVFLPSMQSDNLRRLRLEDELRQAVRDNALTVAYQPVLTLATGELEGYEALARWHHAELGTIAPDVFIPLAEQVGLIREIGLQVLEQARAGAVQLARASGRRTALAVNLSPLQVADPELLTRVHALTAAHPELQLVLELTELSRLNDDSVTAQALDALVAAGAQLAVDDFGTGYSSISYLNRLPVTVLKVDRSFTADLASPRTLALVHGVIAMASAMGLRVVAEGIEDGWTAQTLRDLGCDSGQGYLFSRPLALADALAALPARAAVGAVGAVAAQRRPSGGG